MTGTEQQAAASWAPASEGPAAPPSAGSLHLWLLRLPGLDEGSFDTSVLDATELRQAAAFRRPADRVRYTAAHIALRRLLGGCLGKPPQSVELEREPCPCCGAPHGRPAIAQSPVPLHFSLSHGGDLVLIGLAAAPVGVDVEAVPAASTVSHVGSALHPAEQAEIAAAATERRAEVFARLWTRKEAYLKGIGTGLARGLAADYLGTSGAAEPPPGWTVRDLPAGGGHAAAAAVQGSLEQVLMRQVPAGLLRARPG